MSYLAGDSDSETGVACVLMVAPHTVRYAAHATVANRLLNCAARVDSQLGLEGQCRPSNHARRQSPLNHSPVGVSGQSTRTQTSVQAVS